MDWLRLPGAAPAGSVSNERLIESRLRPLRRPRSGTIPPQLRWLALLVVAAGGAAARGSLSGGASHYAVPVARAAAASILAVLGLASITLTVLCLRSGAWRRRDPEDPPHVVEMPSSRLARLAAVTITIGGLAATLALAVILARSAGTGQRPATSTGTGPVHPTAPPSARQVRPSANRGHGLTPTGIGGLTAVVVAAGGAIAYSRRRGAAEDTAVAEPTADAAPGSLLGQTLRGGAQAMTGVEDARAAIIACYAAMEDRLASGGLARGAAQTPSELLASATASGLVPALHATQLTGLFQRARFGTEPMTAEHRRDAARALDRLRSNVRTRS